MTTENQKLRAAVIGLGFIGAGDPVSGDAIGQNVKNLEGTHAHSLAAHPQVELVAGSSRDEGRRKRFEERMGVDKTYTDWREMLKAEKLDIVGIATNSPYHAEVTIACAEAGVRGVFCEKPITTRLRDADHVIKICREHGTILAVNHQRRWHPLWLAVADEIRNGAIGDVYHVMLHWTSGRLGNVGTHWFDAIAMLLDATPQAVSGTFDPVISPDCRGAEYHDPGGWGIVKFSNGTKVFVHGPQDAKIPLLLRFVGSKGELTIRAGTDVSVELWNGDRRPIVDPGENGPNAMELAIQDVVKCLDTGGTPADSGEDALGALETIIGFHVSNRLNGQWVPLPITGADRDLEVLIG